MADAESKKNDSHISEIVNTVEGKTTAMLARLPTYFHPSSVLVIGEDEPPLFFFTIGFMFLDAEVHALSTSAIPPTSGEKKSRVKSVEKTKDLGLIDLIIYKSTKMEEKTADELLAVMKKHSSEYLLAITESENKLKEKFYQYDITSSGEFAQTYFPLEEKVFLIRKK